MEYPSKVLAALGRLSAAACVIVLLAGATVAYTIVKKDGQRIEIPAEFSVTHTTLTYEVSPGFQITLHLATIDVAATERANGEQPGSFLRRAIETARRQAGSEAVPIEPVSTTRAQRTVSNRDLATYARKRQESEVAYERRRKELGLPSVKESRQRREAEEESFWQEIQQRKEDEAESESLWRGRASELRAELAAVDAEISYVRTRIDELSRSYAANPYGVFPNVYPYGYEPYDPRYSGQYGSYDPRYRGGQYGRYGRRPYSEPRSGWPYRTRNRYRGSRRDPVLVNPGFPIGGGFAGPLNGTFRSGRVGNGRSIVTPRRLRNHADMGVSFQDPIYAPPVLAYDAGYDSSLLVARLDELLAKRESLIARWRELEQEARRAGVPPGWLRP